MAVRECTRKRSQGFGLPYRFHALTDFQPLFQLVQARAPPRCCPLPLDLRVACRDVGIHLGFVRAVELQHLPHTFKLKCRILVNDLLGGQAVVDAVNHVFKRNPVSGQQDSAELVRPKKFRQFHVPLSVDR